MDTVENHCIKYELDNIKEDDSIYRCYNFEHETIDNITVSIPDEDPDNYLLVKGIIKCNSSSINNHQYNKYILIALFRKKQVCFIPIMETNRTKDDGIYQVATYISDQVIFNQRPKPYYEWETSHEEPSWPSKYIVIGKKNAYKLALKHKHQESEKTQGQIKEMESYLKNN